MTPAEQSVLDALVELEGMAAAARKGGLKPDLSALLARIDRLAGCLPPETDARLRHFLERKSYQKARLHLESGGGRIQSGTCG